MLSLVPYSECFYCGRAGPESMIEVESEAPLEYTFNPVQVIGVLKLNDADENQLFYILENAGSFFK